jgi:small conductance mechanosensitive channel
LFQNPVQFFEDHAAAYLSGITVMVVGFFAARWVGHVVAHTLEKQPLEPPVRLLMVRMVRLFMLGLTLVIALGAAGFQITALVAGLGVVGVGIGLGMQGLLSNVVAGLTIIFTKPFRVGEYIEILGVQGLVMHIDLVSTTLQHGDASRVVIPNHKIIGEILHNFGTTRQLDLSVGVGYNADLKKVQALVGEILQGNARVLKNPEPVVTISALGDSSINVSIKPWAKLGDVGLATTELNAAILERFRASQIEIPFPQREIRILKE